jgi:chemotaxis protein MotB
MSNKSRRPKEHDDGEFLWLVSLSDLMILLFVFFVVLFSFSFKKMTAADLREAVAVFNGETKTPIDKVEENLKAELASKGISDQINVLQKDGVLILSIRDSVLFNSGQYFVKSQSFELLKTIAHAIETIPENYHLGIEGHTDDVPIVGPRVGGLYADNWELSVKRALEVFSTLNLSETLQKRAVIMGYGSMNPLVPNIDENGTPIPENRAKNRRVTLRIF